MPDEHLDRVAVQKYPRRPREDAVNEWQPGDTPGDELGEQVPFLIEPSLARDRNHGSVAVLGRMSVAVGRSGTSLRHLHAGIAAFINWQPAYRNFAGMVVCCRIGSPAYSNSLLVSCGKATCPCANLP